MRVYLMGDIVSAENFEGESMLIYYFNIKIRSIQCCLPWMVGAGLLGHKFRRAWRA